MLDKRTYHTSLCEKNNRYKIKSKGLLKSVRIVRNAFDPLPFNPKLYINGRLVDISINNEQNKHFFDFTHMITHIRNKQSSYDEDDEVDYHVLCMMILSANAKCIPHYSHLSLEDINSGFFTHEIDLEIGTSDMVLLKEIKIEEEFYIPTFKLNMKENKEEEKSLVEE
jgi:hypothetical protein